MRIKSENFAAVIFLLELHTQCDLFNISVSYLKKVVQRRADRNKGKYTDDKFPPIEIIAQCTVCLSSLANIRRILFTIDRETDDRKGLKVRQKIKSRCKSLMVLLGNPVLEYIASPTVRNAWEHIDENLDKLLAKKKYASIYQIYIVGGRKPDCNSYVLKSFNTNDLSIGFADKIIKLQLCVLEINILSERVNLALSRLQNEKHPVY